MYQKFCKFNFIIFFFFLFFKKVASFFDSVMSVSMDKWPERRTKEESRQRGCDCQLFLLSPPNHHAKQFSNEVHFVFLS